MSSKQVEYSSRARQLAENFRKDRSIDNFGRGIEELARDIGTSAMLLYMQIANAMNLEDHGGKSYECEPAKKGEADCGKCKNFVWEMDGCSEDSVIAPLYRVTHPESKPATFEKRDGEMTLIFTKRKKD